MRVANSLQTGEQVESTDRDGRRVGRRVDVSLDRDRVLVPGRLARESSCSAPGNRRDWGGRLARSPIRDTGRRRSISAAFDQAARAQYSRDPDWTRRLHYDNLRVASRVTFPRPTAVLSELRALHEIDRSFP